MIDLVPLFSDQPHSLDELLTLVLHCCPTLTYGSKKSLLHSDGHTPVPRFGSRAKLGEGKSSSKFATVTKRGRGGDRK